MSDVEGAANRPQLELDLVAFPGYRLHTWEVVGGSQKLPCLRVTLHPQNPLAPRLWTAGTNYKGVKLPEGILLPGVWTLYAHDSGTGWLELEFIKRD